MAGIRSHTATHSPIALYQFDKDLLDTSGNGRHLTALVGDPLYAPIFPQSPLGYVFQGGGQVGRPSYDAAFALLGDFTVEMILSLGNHGYGTQFIFGFCGVDAGSEVAAQNTLYSLWESGVASHHRCLEYRHEQAAGVNVELASTFQPAAGVPTHVWVRRASNVVSIGVNGVVNATSGTLLAPTGGTSSRLLFGQATHEGSPQGFYGALCSFKLHNTALSDAQLLADFEATVGIVYPRVAP